MLNRVVLIGRLVADPELRTTKNGISVASFTLAVDRKYKNADGGKDTDFISIVVWRQQAESCNSYLSKGKLAAVDGSLQIRSYEAKDGTKRKVIEVVAEDVRFLSPKDGESPKRKPHKESSFQQEDKPFNAEEDMVGDDDLPF